MRYKHGLSKHRLHNIWRLILKRCQYDKAWDYTEYGGRGITICDSWSGDFKAFFDYVTALPNYGEVGYTLDRIDNNGNYEPGNVRWADRHVQSANKRVYSTNKSGYTGVGFHKKYKKWYVNIGVRGKLIYLGSYEKLKDAVMARNRYITDNNLTEYPIQTI